MTGSAMSARPLAAIIAEREIKARQFGEMRASDPLWRDLLAELQALDAVIIATPAATLAEAMWKLEQLAATLDGADAEEWTRAMLGSALADVRRFAKAASLAGERP